MVTFNFLKMCTNTSADKKRINIKPNVFTNKNIIQKYTCSAVPVPCHNLEQASFQ